MMMVIMIIMMTKKLCGNDVDDVNLKQDGKFIVKMLVKNRMVN